MGVEPTTDPGQNSLVLKYYDDKALFRPKLRNTIDLLAANTSMMVTNTKSGLRFLTIRGVQSKEKYAQNRPAELKIIMVCNAGNLLNGSFICGWLSGACDYLKLPRCSKHLYNTRSGNQTTYLEGLNQVFPVKN